MRIGARGKHVIGAALLGGLLAMTGPAQALPQTSSTAVPGVGTVRGRVVDWSTGRAIAGARVSLPDLGMRAASDRAGAFRFDGVPASAPYRRLRAQVTAPGHGRWTISGVPLYPEDTLELSVEMRRARYDHRVLTPEERAANPGPQAPASTYDFTCTGWKGEQVPPETISVYLTEDDKSKTYDFDYYVRHVLPNEWISSWDLDALGAGAIAAKTYGAYRAKPNHAYSGGDDCADVVDSVADQVFDPTWSNERTDKAVYATLGSIYWRDGGLFLSQYYAGAKDDPCAPVEGEFAGRMSQWGTETCATDDPPVLWPDIVDTYYDQSGNTEWLTLDDLMLNPGVENSQLYAWLTGTQGGTTITRVKGDAHEGNWYLAVTATSAMSAPASPAES
jgi:hypothetical protein